jgi:hypothetical protein
MSYSMDPEVNIDAETTEEQKEIIEEEQEVHQNDIIEADEAAGAAEGFDNREDNILSEDVPSDRDATPPDALELSEDSIVQ